MKEYSGNIVDIVYKKIYKGRITIKGNKILCIEKTEDGDDCFIVPGFVDSHIHIESSMLSPGNFAAEVVKHGTVAVVSDPHEIANVLGVDGVDFMIKDAAKSPLKFYFGAPSCVPATDFESSGAKLDAATVKELLGREDIYFLSEMMNFPGVINNDPEVHRKLEAARLNNKLVDGHGPGLKGEDLKKYVSAGVHTDHECFTYEEAVDKINLGMIVQIREGSAARNFENLYKLIDEFPDNIMLCSDDLHPDDLIKGHINLLVKKALDKGLDLFNVLRAAIYKPIKHYNLPVGLLQDGDNADFIIVNNLKDFDVLETIIDGEAVYSNNKVLFEAFKPETPNKFYRNPISESSFKIESKGDKVRVIKVLEGELITKQFFTVPNSINNFIESDISNDILKVSVVNRYEKERPSVGLINGFNFKKGGIVSSIAHDSHNIIVVGVNDKVLSELVSWVQQNKGGIAVHDGNKIYGLPLPLAGIISDLSAVEVAISYAELDKKIRKLGSELRAPFMTLAFMALLVIPELKIGNKGLFDVTKFAFTNLFVQE